MPQGLSNAPATFNRMVSQILRPLRHFAPSYFDDIFVHSKAEGSKSALEVHLDHLRQLFTVMRQNKLYASLKKCVFAAPEIPVLGCFVSEKGTRADPEKIKAVSTWPTPCSVKDLRQFLGLANYLHKYSKNYAALVRPLTSLLRKDVVWQWSPAQQAAFDATKRSLREAPVLALADYSKPFHVVCNASDFAIGCALMQHDDEGHERVVSYQSRQLKPAERNYPVHDKELLAMKYALVKLRVYLLGESKFVIYTDHASLRTATKSPHLSQRMARWLSFFAEYNFVVLYKPGSTNILADALSRRPDFDPKNPSFNDSEDLSCLGCHSEHLAPTVVRPVSTLTQDVIAAYPQDAMCQSLLDYFKAPSEKALDALPPRLRAKVHRFHYADGLLYYSIDNDTPRVVVPLDSELRLRILFEYHDSPMGGHLGREKTFLAVSRDFYWSHQYNYVRKYVRSCDTCQRVKPSLTTQAPLRSLPIPLDCWRSISMDFIFGLPPDRNGRTGILVFVDRFSKMVHLIPVHSTIDAVETARLFVAHIFRLHGMPTEVVSDRDPRFTSKFWRAVFLLVGTKLSMSTAAHPQTDGQTERANRTLEDVLRSYATSFKDWSEFLALVEFAMNHSVHSTTGVTPFFLNTGRHPLVPATILGNIPTNLHPREGDSRISGGGDSVATSSAHEGAATAHEGAVQHEEHSDARVLNEQEGSDTAHEGAVQHEEHLDARVLNEQEGSYNFEKLDSLDNMTASERKSVNDFLLNRQVVVRYVRDAMADAVDKQKENSDRYGRKNKNVFKRNALVLLSAANLPISAVSNLGSSKLTPRFVGPFKITKRVGDAYTLDIPSAMKLHPTFYVGRLKPYHQHAVADSAPVRGKPNADDALVARKRRESARTRAAGRLSVERTNCSCRELTGGLCPSCGVHGGLVRPPPHVAQPHSGDSQLPALACGVAKPRKRGFERPGPAPVVDNQGAKRWVVDKILDHKDPSVHERMAQPSAARVENNPSQTQSLSREYLVRWLGYSANNDSWEPLTSLARDVPDVVQAYEQALPPEQRLQSSRRR